MPRLSEYVGSCTADDLRDLELLAKVREHPVARYVLLELREIITHVEFYEAPTREAAELALQLLAPGDAGRDILRPLSEAEYEAAPAPSSEQIKDALRKGAEDMARMQRKGRRRLR